MHELVDFGHRTVGELLHVVLCAALFVFRGELVLQQLLQVLVGIAAQVAHGDLGFLAFVAGHLGQLAAALFGQRGHRHAQ